MEALRLEINEMYKIHFCLGFGVRLRRGDTGDAYDGSRQEVGFWKSMWNTSCPTVVSVALLN